MTGTVVDNSAACRDLGSVLLLMLCAQLKTSIAEYLQVNQAQTNGPAPQKEYGGQQVEPDVGGIARRTGCHQIDLPDKKRATDLRRLSRIILSFPDPCSSVQIRGLRFHQPDYGTEITDTEATLAITGVPASGNAESIRITCPARGGSMPYSRANLSMRSGERSEASSRRSARFISSRPSRWLRSDSTL